MKESSTLTLGSTPLFLHLLSTAIWNKPADSTLFKGLPPETWNEIVDMARRQTVSALIADKALSLPKESLPPLKLRLQFMVMIQQTEALNRKMIQVLKDLSQEYQEANFPFCLLKGLGVGVNYPSPLLRNAGDLDLWLYQEGDYEKSEKWLLDQGFDIKKTSLVHYDYKKDGVSIENHTSITTFDKKKYNQLLTQWLSEVVEEDSFTTIDFDGFSVKQLPIDLNAFYIFQHLFRHFIYQGVGFRQFCDWLLFLSKSKDDIDTASFTAIAKSYALIYPMQVFARAAVKYLDAPEDIFPFPMIDHNRHVDLIVADILHSGNFGFHQPSNQRPKGRLAGIWFSYKTAVQRSIQFAEISPEHNRGLPVYKLLNHFKVAFK